MAEQITRFPQSVIAATPVELYQSIVYGQISSGKGDRIYTPGPVTSGWAFNFTRNMSDVITWNAEFAKQFTSQVLLNKQRPVIARLPQNTFSLADTHITLPHALGKCELPTSGDEKQKYWGEFNYYVVWLMTMMGLEPGLAGAFASALEKDVDITIVNDRLGARSTRVNEVQKVFRNAVSFMRKHHNQTSPVSAVIALPEPARTHHEVSVGTELEAQYSQALDIPLAQFTINARAVSESITSQDSVWDGPVATWLLGELADQPEMKNSDQLVEVTEYRQLQPW